MPVFTETIANPKDYRAGCEWALKSAGMVKKLRALSEDQCITLLPDTDIDSHGDLQGQRVRWINAARGAGISVITRSVLTDKGEKAIRIWRTDYP